MYYHGSVGLISSRCAVANWWTDPPPAHHPIAPRSAALQPHCRVQCPCRWKLFHFTAVSSENLPPRRNESVSGNARPQPFPSNWNNKITRIFFAVSGESRIIRDFASQQKYACCSVAIYMGARYTRDSLRNIMRETTVVFWLLKEDLKNFV